ncbi:MAG: tRNA uridine-5-carboxymethylaminomethyl(34) synthesis GTPase MnmE [Pseudomonadota bacterium]
MPGAGETIVALATPPGRGGVGVVRLSGPHARAIAGRVARHRGAAPSFRPRQMQWVTFVDDGGQPLDSGLIVYFQAPASFTGEDVVECHGHGSPHALDELLRALLVAGARQARAGEFSQRAFLNGKLDLSQAEAVADLIAAGTAGAARAATRSLQGQLSHDVHALGAELLRLRAWCEATIDFDDEDDVARDNHGPLGDGLRQLHRGLRALRARCVAGRALREGLTVVLAGPPNAGKSSLMNALADDDVAIVTDTPGTTRDLLRETLNLDGLPVHVVDTAGLRETDETVERAGIERARAAMAKADRVLYVVDASEVDEGSLDTMLPAPAPWPDDLAVTLVRNKIDLIAAAPDLRSVDDGAADALLSVSAHTGAGLDHLRAHLRSVAGLELAAEQAGDALSARTRHIDALDRTADVLARIEGQWQAGEAELVAEELRAAHTALMEITGETTQEDLLGEIFSRFCIGK